MARTFREMEIEGRRVLVLFDTGSLRSYVRKGLTSKIAWKTIPFKVGLGGRYFEIDDACMLNCAIDGLGFDIEAHPIDDLGEERGRRIDAIIGAMAMEKWGLIPDPKTGEIDLTVLRKREFIEY